MKMEELVKDSWKALTEKAREYGIPDDHDNLHGAIEAIKPRPKNVEKFHKDPIVIWNLAYLQGAADAYDVTLIGLLDEAL